MNQENGEDAHTRCRSLQMCRQFLGGSWTTIPLEKFKFERISGGLSNYLYLCSLPDDYQLENGEPRHVLVRLYGEIMVKNTEFIVNDSVVFALLSEKQLGPKLYGVFQGGRVEEYIKSRCLRTPELKEPRICATIARKLARMHRLEMPTKKEPHYLFEHMRMWLEDGLDKVDTTHFTAEKQSEYKKLHSYNLHKEMQWLQKLISQVSSPIVFCHNDLQEGNILCESEENKANSLMLIDFEYANYNYRGFDIGNHFCEWMYDYSIKKHPYFSLDIENYPNKEEQVHFLTEYLKEMGSDPSESLIHDMLVEVNTYSLVADFNWSIWSLAQAQLSTIKFGYLEYALRRLEVYFDHKKCLPMLAERGCFQH